MRAFLKREALILAILLLPFVLIILKWNAFPDQVPMHFNAKGEVDRVGDKVPGLLLTPLMNIGLYFLFMVLPKIDPRRMNYAKFEDKYRMIRLSIHIFMTFIFVLIAAHSLGYRFGFPKMVLYGVLLLFLVLGNYFRTVRPNYFIGVRTPWTLANEVVWTKTHRFTASLWVITSLIMMAVLPFLGHIETVLIVYIAIVTVIPIGYSYIVFRRVTDSMS